jgi:nuclear pore complex protein Nup155
VTQAARDARDRRDPESAADAVAESLGLLLSVPLSGDPTAVCAELADLRCFHGLVALPLAAAAAAASTAAAGGNNVGSLGYANGFDDGAGQGSSNGNGNGVVGVGNKHAGAGGLGASGASPPPAPAECFEYVCVALRALATGAADPGAPPGSLGAVCAGLSAEERAVGLSAMLERAAQASSPAAAAAATAAVNAAAANATAAAAAAANGNLGNGNPNPYAPRLPSAAVTAVAAATPAEVAGAGYDGGGSLFIRRVYAELVSLGRDAELLSLPAVGDCTS